MFSAAASAAAVKMRKRRFGTKGDVVMVKRLNQQAKFNNIISLKNQNQQTTS